MTKRKADIFTVVEFVPNWFAARQEDKALPKGSKGTPTYGPGPSFEAWTSIQPTRPTNADTVANWSGTSANTWLLVKGSECTSSWNEAN